MNTACMMTEPNTSVPLCVDLDGTLVKTDTFVQALILLIRNRPAALFSFHRWMSGGPAAFKQRVAQEVEIDPAALPYHTGLLTFLQNERATGRELILTTASDMVPARAVAAQLGIFSDVMASDGKTNLKAGCKRTALAARFGEKNFDYAGNSGADIPVWNSAREIIAVNPDSSARRFLKNKPARMFEDRPPAFKCWIKALRVRQWIKNILVFVPMILAHRLTEPALYINAVLAFFAFSCMASAIYVCNDLFDLNSDQHHPRKKFRPFAAGNISANGAVISFFIMLIASFAVAGFLPAEFSRVLILYLILNACYSWRLKQIALLDVLLLAFLYVLRIIAGTAAYGVETSPWLIAFSMFLFFSLALIKRYAELRESNPEKVKNRGRGYRAADLPLLAAFGAGSGTVAVLVLALYINSAKVVQFYPSPAILWLLCPVFFYWVARLWLLAGRGEIPDDPLEFSVRDVQTWIIGAFSAVILILGSIA
ncbi:MAG: UbiA family prenyltransferase [Kiritimatiellales bacterium]